ncbi:hypothetical protein [Streptococcus sp. A12]|nr:hypothetical protein [Streptococcus sp. A12]
MSRREDYFAHSTVPNEKDEERIKALANKQERTFTKKQVMSNLK